MQSCFSRIWQTKIKKLRRDLSLNSNGVGVLQLHVLRKGSTETLDSLFVRLFSNYFPELCRTSGLLWKGFVGSCLSKRRDRATLGTHLIQGFGGVFCFLKEHTWGILCVFPWNQWKSFSLLLVVFTFWGLGCCSGFSPCCTKLFMCIQEGCGQNEKEEFQTSFPAFLKVFVKKQSGGTPTPLEFILLFS